MRGSRCLAWIAGAALVTTGLLATAPAEVGTAPAPVAAEPVPAPAAAEPAAEPATSRFRPDTTVQWVGVVGFLLILLRGACRR